MGELNNKITVCLDLGNEMWEYQYDAAKHEAANEIEKLILQEKIDLLKEVRKNIGENVPFPAAPSWTIVNDKISELTNQLKALT